MLALLGGRSREDLLREYNAASAAWPEAQLTFMQAAANVSITGDGGTLVLLPFTDFTDEYKDTAGMAGVNQPTSLYKMSQLQDMSSPIASASSYSNGQAVGVTVQVGGVLSYISLPIFRDASVSAGKTTVNGMLKTVCFVVSSTTLRVSVDKSVGGCNWDKDSHISWNSWKGVPSSGPFSFQGVRFSARSDKDPFVVALQITDGSLDFGPASAIKLGVGLAFLLTALAIFQVQCSKLNGLPPPPPRMYMPPVQHGPSDSSSNGGSSGGSCGGDGGGGGGGGGGG
jgi:hypothetical protein